MLTNKTPTALLMTDNNNIKSSFQKTHMLCKSVRGGVSGHMQRISWEGGGGGPPPNYVLRKSICNTPPPGKECDFQAWGGGMIYLGGPTFVSGGGGARFSPYWLFSKGKM